MNYFLLRATLRHFFWAKFWNGHSVQSPFVYDFVRHVVSRKANDDMVALNFARGYRKSILANNDIIDIKDLGTGHDRQERISDIAKKSSIPDKCGRLLMRMVEHYKPYHIVELGTSVGISTAYLAAHKIGVIFTIEGNKSSSEVAQNTLRESKVDNVVFFNGDFDDCLSQMMDNIIAPNLFFVDGNHTYEATMRYFNIIAQKAVANKTIIVFDDIHWSAGMQRAWNEISADDRVATSIDLLRMGVVFFRSGCPKEHYCVRW
ncbi:MAG: class I SAM-dependent methyltransferase [Bacteroidales bacterium]|nr:class I SAM-dependent methyltransferase [Bacteroidales bacterium]